MSTCENCGAKVLDTSPDHQHYCWDYPYLKKEKAMKPNEQIQVSQALLERANSVREYVKACNTVVKELTERGVDVEFYFNGKKLEGGILNLDFEIRMILPQEPISL